MSHADRFVTFAPEYIQRFAESWPCSGLALPDGSYPEITFVYDTFGNLIDILGEPPGADGHSMLALSQDALVRHVWGEGRPITCR